MSRDGIEERRSPDGEVAVWRVEVDGRAAARAALREILARHLGVAPDAIELATGDSGKPRLASAAMRPGTAAGSEPPAEAISFNLSHSGGLALVAVAEGFEVGVDVERLKPRRDLVRLARRWLPAADAEAIAAAAEAERERLFYAAWTRHEARVKCIGTGLAGPAPGPEVVAHELAIDEGYAAAVATTIDAPRIVVQTFEE